MSEKFDTFSSRPRKYYVLNIISLITIAIPVLGYLTNLEISQKYASLLGLLIGAGLITVPITMLLTVMGRMYTIDGELVVSTEAITFKTIEIPFGDIQRIDIKASDYKGARSSDGSGNKIEVHLNDRTVYATNYVIRSKTQKNSLSQIIEEWESAGMNIGRLAFS